MRTVSVTNRGSEPPGSTRKEATASGDFEALLTETQSAQLVAGLGVLADATGLAKRAPDEKPSARQARVGTETAEARQAEAQARSARRSDSATQDNGSYAVRRARALAHDAEASSNGARRDSRAGESNRAAGGGEVRGADSGERLASDGRANARSTAPPTDSGKTDFKAQATVKEAPAAKQAASPGTDSADAAGKAVTVATAGAARRVNGAANDRSASPAQIVGRALAGRGATETASATRVIESAEIVRNSGSSARNKGAGANAAKETRQTGSEAKGASTRGSREADFLRLVQQVRLRGGMKTSSATIRLDPPELGRMRVEVRLANEVLEVRVEAASADARELLHGRAEELLSALRSHNIDVGRFEIVALEDGGGGGAETTNPHAGGAGAQAFGGDHAAEGGSSSSAGHGSQDLNTSPEEIATVAKPAVDNRLDVRV